MDLLPGSECYIKGKSTKYCVIKRNIFEEKYLLAPFLYFGITPSIKVDLNEKNFIWEDAANVSKKQTTQ